MINFRVKPLKTLLEKLNDEGVSIVGDTVQEEYRKVGWILDPEGNKIELWELTGSNRRPSACKADALNQLS